MKEKVEKFIEYLLEKGYSKQHNIHSEFIDFEYYYNITGFIKGKYFSVCICKLRNHEKDIEISDVTDCYVEIGRILDTFELL